MKINLFKTQDIHQTLFEVDENGREINIYELKRWVGES